MSFGERIDELGTGFSRALTRAAGHAAFAGALRARLRAAAPHPQLRAVARARRATGLRIDVLIVSCAVSAGIHGALAREHFGESAGAGGGFVAATVLLAAVVVAVTRRPESRLALGAAILVLAGLIGSYGLATTTGVPVMHPGVEPLDGFALCTKAVEALGLLAATGLLWRSARGPHLQPKGA